jgi:phage tail-like protein
MDIRAEFNHETLLPLLPRPYRDQAFHDDQLTRLLSLFETFFDDVDDLTAEQVAWLDPAAAPAAVLPWLASWLQVDLDDRWSDEQRRRAISGAYAHFARVGTSAALGEALWREAGVRAVIHEPLQSRRPWVLGGCAAASSDPASLGSNTSLAAVDPDGAILGRTATLGGSHLIRGDAFGAPLFDDVAHRFTVHITERAFRTGRRQRAERIIEQHRPAHTQYQLSEIRPALSVGLQAHVGITTIIGQRRLAGRLNDGPMVLGGEPAGLLGTRLEIGRSTRL